VNSGHSRHRAQAGTTLVELVVSIAIIGLAVVLLIGALSTALIDVTKQRQVTVTQAAIEFELQRIQAAAYTSTPAPYSECFADDTGSPPTAVGYQGSCPGGTKVRLDVTEADAVTGGVQQWTVKTISYPAGGQIGSPVSIYKINR
jgi:type II secretory pathway pseudopilin PulG